ncbi:NrfD/PsrC family molybdoenzyme membrane anchor subunit [Metallosphaera hakonensis]|uniref:Nitrite reductase n=1 Tax=Metallosphaera hakonensis JCM 8857 = DSM 7519 TaxID=1293036 RepID=A0A2U9IRU2_9CREN|nr:NrfD/PsrC family molybdoenzyme membrane anchor subunit [Metallosphaera hakonensis]AWR98736.1 nitrite reductase [Metallosphaera hakonensis JCM 8857 = DSM 7519]
MGLFSAPSPGTSFGIQAPIIQINQYPLWSEYVALALYFTEIAGMLMAIIGLMEVTGRFGSFTKRASVVTFIAAILALGFFDADLGRPSAAISSPIEALANFSHSWMARGIIFVGGLLLFSFLYMIVTVANMKSRLIRGVIAIIGVFAGIFSTTYSGFELAATTGVPFWNNGGIPALYLADGIFAAAGLAYLIALVGKSEDMIRARVTLTKLLLFSSVAELATWFLFMASVNFIYVFDQVAYNYLISQASFYADMGLTALTLVISGIGGLAISGVPMMGMKGQAPSKAVGQMPIMDLPAAIKYLMIVAAIFALVAGYLTRADILFAGQYAYQLAPMTPFQIVTNQPIPIGSFGWRG